MQPRLPAGIYIHWPFCARKCPYCDFYTFGREHQNFGKAGRYLERLLEEIRAYPRQPDCAEEPDAETIYFGGGTPSLMEPRELGAILDALRGVFCLAPDSEITLEVNPTAAEAERLAPALELGVNRLSVGVQSFNDRLLKILGRDHDAQSARRVLDLIRRIGCENVSVDLMFGLPDQSLADFQADVEKALSFSPEHLSVYGLTLHEGTPFKRWRDEGKLNLPDPEIEAAQLEWLIGRMENAGYVHYEISNWARSGRESRHNSKYWRQCDIHAFGVSAHGVRSGHRYAHARDLDAYLRGKIASQPYEITQENGSRSVRSVAGEVMMLALRRIGGTTWSELDAWIEATANPWPTDGIRSFYQNELKQLEEIGWIETDADRLRLSRRGILFADSVMEKFF